MTVKGVDLTGMDKVWVSFADTTRTIEVRKDSPTLTLDDTDTVVTCTLSQAESGQFLPNCPVSIQVNWMKNNVRGATKIVTVPCWENLIKEVLTSA